MNAAYQLAGFLAVLATVEAGSWSGATFVTPSSPLTWESMSPGNWSDGLLLVPLDHANTPSSPNLTLHVRGRAALNQPASLGTALIHCGGPGSLRDCAERILERLPADVLEAVQRDMNVWSIDQRGMGTDNTPNLSCDRIWLPDQPKELYTISDFTDCDCAMPDDTPLIDECMADMDPDNETQVRAIYTGAQQRGERCYSAAQFQLHGSRNESFNFLDYIGTSSLAQDMEVFRGAIGEQLMSVYGLSYGTGVGATYGSMFPDSADRILINGNMDSSADLLEFGEANAKTNSQSIEHLLRLCAEQSSCALHQLADKDPYDAWDRLMAMLTSAHGITASGGDTAKGEAFRLTAGNLLGLINGMMVGAYKKGVEHSVLQIVYGLLSSNNTLHLSTVESVLDQMCQIQLPASSGTPVYTWRDYGICIGMAQLGAEFLPQTSVIGMDYTGRYTTDQFVNHWRHIRNNFPIGLTAYVGCFGGIASWPGTPTPSGPYGDPRVKALVVGNLYDPSTGYTWSQKMHQAFPSGALLTWQGIGHTLESGAGVNDPVGAAACARKMYQYLLYGDLPKNGMTCHNGHKAVV